MEGEKKFFKKEKCSSARSEKEQLEETEKILERLKEQRKKEKTHGPTYRAERERKRALRKIKKRSK